MAFDTADGRWSKLASHSPGWSDAAGWDDAANYPTIRTAVVGDQLFLLARANAGIHTWSLGNELDRPPQPALASVYRDPGF